MRGIIACFVALAIFGVIAGMEKSYEQDIKYQPNKDVPGWVCQNDGGVRDAFSYPSQYNGTLTVNCMDGQQFKNMPYANGYPNGK